MRLRSLALAWLTLAAGLLLSGTGPSERASARPSDRVRPALEAEVAAGETGLPALDPAVRSSVHAAPAQEATATPPPTQGPAILGATLTVAQDGTWPWEDRPLWAPEPGRTIPGTYGQVDPGDDTGPDDGTVRSWDVVVYRLAISVRGGTAEDIVATVRLDGPAVWGASHVDALRYRSCPGGVTVDDDGRELRCVVGDIVAPPAKSLAIDLVARVPGDAPHGATIGAWSEVRARRIEPDPVRERCPEPDVDGCDDRAPDVTVSAAPATELRKALVAWRHEPSGGRPGRVMTWRLEAIAGADGDIRGTSPLHGAPWTLPDWWEATTRGGRPVDLPVELVDCHEFGTAASWSCAQSAGAGEPVEVTIDELDVMAALPDGVSETRPVTLGGVEVVLWVPEEDVLDAGWDVTFLNCFATEIGIRDVSLWRPVDAAGQPNLNGLDEPVSDNCASAILPVPRPTPRSGSPPRRPPPGGGGGPGRPNPPPRDSPTPEATIGKRYRPIGGGAPVIEGMTVTGEVSLHVLADHALDGVVLCDKWDNATHVLDATTSRRVTAWWKDGSGEPVRMPLDGITIEYARGAWGNERTPPTIEEETWYVQSTSACDGSAALMPGWVGASEVDLGNTGGRALDAADVNMVRVRFHEPVPAGLEVWMDVPLVVGRNPGGAWLMNYAAAAWGAGRGRWRAEPCYGAAPWSGGHYCPASGIGVRPGPLGDVLRHVGAPVWVEKVNDPIVRGGSPIVTAGQTTAFSLTVSTHPRPDDPPPPPYPPGVVAIDVKVTDTLPAGLYYIAGSSTIDSEDLDGDGVLDPGEDRDGNGRIDGPVSFEPDVTIGQSGSTTLEWSLGDLPYRTTVPTLRFEARVSRVVAAGTSLVNRATAASWGEAPARCRERFPTDYPVPFLHRRPGGSARPASDIAQVPERRLPVERCAWAQVIVTNDSRSQIEKLAYPAVVLTGEPLRYELMFANLDTDPVEWFDAVDLLPVADEARVPATRLGGEIRDVAVRQLAGSRSLEIWASTIPPRELDTRGGGARDGLVDPVVAWGAGEELPSVDWPCRLADIGTTACRFITSTDEVTALRFWGADPNPDRSGGPRDSFLPVDGAPYRIEVTLTAPDTEPGDLAHNAWGGRFEGLPLPVFDNAIIRVRGPATPTPVATDKPLPSTTPTRTSVPSATPTPPGTSTPTAEPIHRAYLPVALHSPCSPRWVDVVLVIDASTSMARDVEDGGSKLDAVIRAATDFLERFEPEEAGGRVAVVAFNNRAWVAQPLTGDRGAIDAALAGLRDRLAEGTRLDLGLSVGATAVEAAAGDRKPVMVFLTDGLPNRVPTPVGGGAQEDTVLVAANDARDLGIEIHTIGFGRPDAPDLADRIAPDLLRAIAGDPQRYHEARDAAVLAEVFRELSGRVGCPQGQRWR